MIILGVDPGATGAVVALEVDEQKEHYRLRGVADWSYVCQHKDLNFAGIITPDANSTLGHRVVAFIEEQKPFAKAGRTMGTKSAFALGENYGWWQGALSQYDCDIHIVPVAHWQKYHFGSGTMIGDPKERSIRAARQKMPDLPLIPDGCRKESHGRADALLIALYGVAWVRQRKEG